MLYVTFLLIIASVFYTSSNEDRSWSIKRKYLTWLSDPFVKYYYYNRRERRYDPEDIVKDIRNESFITSFDPKKPMKIIVSGWKGNNEISFSKYIRDGILENQDVDLISMDWSGYGTIQLNYFRSWFHAPRIASLLASFLDYLSCERGVDLGRVHVLGYSLGAHIAGLAGRMVTKGKIGRITGLDPASILFSEEKADERLNPSSANFVDVIHTCDYLGLNTQMGHVDFYVNGGKCRQPGCGRLLVLCSHRMSFRLYIQSILKQDLFPAKACPSWEDFLRNENCDNVNIVYMGEGLSSKSARGKYYLQTTKDVPYGLGFGGIENVTNT